MKLKYDKLLSNFALNCKQRPCIKEYFRKKEMDLHANVRHVAFFKFVIMVFGFCHWVGCLAYFMSRVAHFSATENQETWIMQYEEDSQTGFRRDGSIMFRYLVGCCTSNLA